jgi:hypothetical protein
LISVQKDVEAENAKFNDAVQKYEAEKSMSKVHKANTHTHSLSLSLYRSRSLILHQVDKLLKEYNAKVEETKKYVAEIPPATPFDMRIKRSPLSLSLFLSVFRVYACFCAMSLCMYLYMCLRVSLHLPFLLVFCAQPSLMLSQFLGVPDQHRGGEARLR